MKPKDVSARAWAFACELEPTAAQYGHEAATRLARSFDAATADLREEYKLAIGGLYRNEEVVAAYTPDESETR